MTNRLKGHAVDRDSSKSYMYQEKDLNLDSKQENEMSWQDEIQRVV